MDWDGFISVVLYFSSMFPEMFLGCIQFVQCTVKEESCLFLNIKAINYV